MKKLSLIVTLILAVLLLEKCKTDTITAYATSSNTMFAVINDTTWSADTINATLTYNAATKTKVFACSGKAKDKMVNIAVTLNTNSNTPGFPLNTFNADAGGLNTFSYAISTGTGNNVFVPQGTVGVGSGTIAFAAVDSVKHQVTGTFSLVTKKTIYDNNGNIVSVTINEVAAGAFNNMPYTFTSN